MHHVITMHMPALETLYILSAGIDALGAYWLAQGDWPLLSYLTLSYNRLGANAVQHLAKGAWPRLQSLSLVGNPFSQRGVKELIKSNWLELNFLILTHHMLNRHSAVMLGLEPNDVSELKDAVACRYLSRSASQTGNNCWSRLSKNLVMATIVGQA